MLTRHSDTPMAPPHVPLPTTHPSLASFRTLYAPCHNNGLPPPALAGKRKR